MKYYILVLALSFAFFIAAEASEETKESKMKIKVLSNGKTSLFQLNNSTASKSLYGQLPLKLKVKDYSDDEKIFYPPKKLDTSDTPSANGRTGTLAYYAPWGDVVMFYKDFGTASGLYELGQSISGTDNIKHMSGIIEIYKHK
jgi:hypothetical protein